LVLCGFATKEAVPQLFLTLKISLLFWDITLYLGFFLLWLCIVRQPLYSGVVRMGLKI